MNDKSANLVADAKRLVISGGNAYGIRVPAECRVWHDKDIEQQTIAAWNMAMAAESSAKMANIPEVDET